MSTNNDKLAAFIGAFHRTDEEGFSPEIEQELMDNFDAIETLQSERSGMEGWQPIETAPRDGTRIIVSKFAWVHRAVEDIFDEAAEKIWHLCFATTAHFLAEKGYWTDGLEKLVEPTHWMPLPQPPAALNRSERP